MCDFRFLRSSVSFLVIFSLVIGTVPFPVPAHAEEAVVETAAPAETAPEDVTPAPVPDVPLPDPVAAPAVVPENPPEQELPADGLIVKYKDDATWLEKEVSPRELQQVITELQSDPAVEYVEPNYTVSILAVQPNDPEYPRQWALPKIHAPEAWANTPGNRDVIIAVLDTGFDYSHPDKPKNVVPGYDFVNGDSDPQDDHGHGTYISGVIAANTDNGTGVAGVCPECSIMPIKVIDGSGMGTYADVAAGIVWAADNGAKIINLSLGGLAYSQALQEAVLYAQSKGALIIAAGGNQGVSDPLYPAAYPDVIGVSATDENDQIWSRSNHGDTIDLAAPGVDVLGLNPGGGYANQTGTSVSAAHVAGIAGLLLSENSALTSGALAQKLFDTAEDLGDQGRDGSFGWGRVDGGAAVTTPEEANVQDPLVGPGDSNEAIGEVPKSHPDENGDDNGNESNSQNDEQFLHNLSITDIQLTASSEEINSFESIDLPGAGTGGEEVIQPKGDISQNNSAYGDKVTFSHLETPDELARTPANNNSNTNKNIGGNQNGGNINDTSNDTPNNFFHNISVKLNGTINIIVYVQNSGQVSEDNIAVRLFVGDIQIGEDQAIPSLKSGAIQVVEFPWIPKIKQNEGEKLIIKAEVKQIADEEQADDNVLTKNILVTDENGVIKIQYDIDPPVHQYLTEQGVYYLNGINSNAYQEMKNYIPQLRFGAKNEDTLRPPPGDPNNNVAWRPLRHFYRPTDKKGYFDGGTFNNSSNKDIFDPDVPDNTRYPNSYEWAINKKLNPSDPDNHYSFQDAIYEYKKGGADNKAKAYQILGHTLHLIEDASAPEHTQLESHSDVFGGLELGSGYEQYVSDQFDYFSELSPQNKFNKLLHDNTCIIKPDDDPRICFTDASKQKIFSYYNEVISKFNSLDQYFDSMATLSYYRNRFKGDLNKPAGEKGELEEIFPNITWNDADKLWEIDRVGQWHDRADGVYLDDEFWETKQFDNNTNEDPGWYYIENSYMKLDSLPVRPAKIKTNWANYAIDEMKKPVSQRFKTPHNGSYVDNPADGKILAEVFAEDLIPLSVQHVAGVMDLFWRMTHQNFTDVARNHWSRKYIDYVYSNGVVQGYGDGAYGPADPVTRAQVLKMAYEGAKKNVNSGAPDPDFADVSASDWFYGYTADAKANGYIQGKPCTDNPARTCFFPDEPIDRYEAAKMVYAVFGNVDYSNGRTGQCSGYARIFPDVNQSDWFCESVHWLANSGAIWLDRGVSIQTDIVSGYKTGYYGTENGTTLNPINRAEMAKIIANTMVFKNTGADNVFPLTDGSVRTQTAQVLTAPSDLITLGKEYEQVFDAANASAPESFHLPSGDSQTITADDTLALTGETADSDGDELFYYWNATGGSFTALDPVRFSSVTWIPPEVTADTAYTISVLRGDGRGYVGEGRVEVLVKPGDPNAPDTRAPVISISAPTKNSSSTITDTAIRVTDNRGILAAQVTLSNLSSARIFSFSCRQTSVTEVNCSVYITGSGDLIIEAIDNAGNASGKTEPGYVLTPDSGDAHVNPTIHSTAAGGNWGSVGTWIEGRLPTTTDQVEINGAVISNFAPTIKGLLINSGSSITGFGFTVNGDVINHGSAESSLVVSGSMVNNGSVLGGGAFYGSLTNNGSITSNNVIAYGSITNNGTWKASFNFELAGTEPRSIGGTTPIESKFVIKRNTIIPITNSPVFAEELNVGGKLILNAGQTLTLLGDVDVPISGAIQGADKIIFGGMDQEFSVYYGRPLVSANEIYFNNNGVLEAGPLTINSKLIIGKNSTLKGGYSLVVNNDVTNNGSILYDSMEISGNITNNGIWENALNTYIAWPSATYELVMRDVKNGVSQLKKGSGNLYNVGDKIYSSHVWRVRPVVSGNPGKWSDIHTINSDYSNQPPNITISAPTKNSNSAITDTQIRITDDFGIASSSIAISPQSAVNVSNFNCVQTDFFQADCSLSMNSNGNLVIKAIDSDMEEAVKTESGYTITSGGNGDITPPLLTQITPVPTPAGDTTPAYTFHSTETGAISYGGACSSATVNAATGNNTVIFNILAAGTYSNCTITVSDASGNSSLPLAVTPFTIQDADNPGDDDSGDQNLPAPSPDAGNSGGGGGGAGSSNTSTLSIPATLSAIAGQLREFSRPIQLADSLLSGDGNGLLAGLLTDAHGSLVLRPQPGSPLTLTIPPDTSVAGPASWNGLLAPPLIRSPRTVNLKGRKVNTLAEAGSLSLPLVFSRPVTLRIPVGIRNGLNADIFRSEDGKTWESLGRTAVTNGIVVVETRKLGYFAITVSAESPTRRSRSPQSLARLFAPSLKSPSLLTSPR